MSADGFPIFGCHFMKKIFKKFLHASMKSLFNSEHSFSEPLQGAFSGFPEAACDSYIVPKADDECKVEKFSQ
jgi:hypothetical protein